MLRLLADVQRAMLRVGCAVGHVLLTFVLFAVGVVGVEVRAESCFRPVTVSMGLPNSQVNCVLQDSRGYVWFGTASGLSRFDGYRFRNYFSYSGNEQTLLNDYVKSIREDKQGRIWVRTQNGYCIFDPATELFDRHPDAKTAERLTAEDRHTRLTDAKGNVWDLTRQWCRVYSAEYKRWFESPADFFAAKGLKANLKGVIVRDLKLDKRKRLWMATDHHGLVMVDWNQNLLKQFTASPDEEGGLPENTILAIAIDSNNALWMGTYRNGAVYYWDAYERFQLVRLGDVCTMVEDPLGNFWCGTNDSGIVCYNRLTGQRQHFGSEQTGLGSNVVVSSLYASDGSLWFGSFKGGLARYQGGRWTVWRKGSSPLQSDNIWALAQDADGRIVMGTLDAGVQTFDPKTGRWTQYCTANSDLNSDYIASLCVGNDQRYYVAHLQNFSVIDPKSGRVENFPTTRSGEEFHNLSVNHVVQDSRGLIWLASQAGVSIYDPQTDHIVHHLNTENGLANNLACLVAEDHSHRMWVGTGAGLSCVKVNKQDDEYRFDVLNYNQLDGMQRRQLNLRAAMVTRDGTLVVGGQEGINLVPNHEFVAPIVHTRVLLSGLRIAGHVVGVGEKFNKHVVLAEDLDRLQRLDLCHDESTFEIQLASSNLVFPPHKMFVCRVEGLHSEWVRTNPDRPHVEFANLSPGKYKLHVQVFNYLGNPISDVRELLIVVHPPVYLTWWAILAYLLVSFGLLYHFVRSVVRRQREQLLVEQLRREAEKDRELDELKTRFFTNVSHELRTPLTLVISPLSKMVKEETDPWKRRKLSFVQRNANNLLTLVNQLLDFRLVDAASEKLHLVSGDVVSFIDNICKSFRLLQDKDIALEFLPAVSTLRMDFDNDKLGKIVNNLLSNAYKFTPAGGRVEVRLRPVESGSSADAPSSVELTVADTGIGISDEDKKHVFDRFFQADNHVEQPYGGSGIGLSLTKDYVLLHGGSISVEDNAGGGTLFRVLLPLLDSSAVAQTEPAVAPTEPTSAPAESATSPTPGNYAANADAEGSGAASDAAKTVAPGVHAKPLLLIVDDNNDFLRFMTDVLKDSYRISTAANGQEALEKVEREQPDAVLSDVMMPIMDGNELCRRMKANPQTERIPFILLTARLSQQHRMEGLESGADDYITKPFDLDMLHLRIANLIKWRGDKNAKLKPQVKEVEITSLDQQFVNQATAYVETHLADDDLSVETLSEALGMSRVHLYKRLLSLTGTTPSEFIRTIRLRRGEQLLRQSQLSVSEIAYKVGFNHPRYFTKYFKEMYGMMPSQYKDEMGN